MRGGRRASTGAPDRPAENTRHRRPRSGRGPTGGSGLVRTGVQESVRRRIARVPAAARQTPLPHRSAWTSPRDPVGPPVGRSLPRAQPSIRGASPLPPPAGAQPRVEGKRGRTSWNGALPMGLSAPRRCPPPDEALGDLSRPQRAPPRSRDRYAPRPPACAARPRSAPPSSSPTDRAASSPLPRAAPFKLRPSRPPPLEGCEGQTRQRWMMTSAPRGRISNSSFTSSFRIRMQPRLTSPPTPLGSDVPWMP